MATQQKLDRKTIAAPDEFQVASGQALTWLEQHRMTLIAAAVGVLLVGVAGAVVSSQRNQAQSTAALAFREAHKQFDASKFAEAAAAFQQVSTAAAGSPFGGLATLYRGHALARQGDGAGAATAYQAYLSTTPVDYLRQQALVGLAAAKEATSDAAGALDSYTQAATILGPLQTDARLGAALIEEGQGHGDAARAIYIELLKDTTLDPAVHASILAKVPVEMRPPESTPPVQ